MFLKQPHRVFAETGMKRVELTFIGDLSSDFIDTMAVRHCQMSVQAAGQEQQGSRDGFE